MTVQQDEGGEEPTSGSSSTRSGRLIGSAATWRTPAPGRRGPGRATRRMGRRPPLPRTRRPGPRPGRRHHPGRGGDQRTNHPGHHGLNYNDEGSPVVHHAPGLDQGKRPVNCGNADHGPFRLPFASSMHRSRVASLLGDASHGHPTQVGSPPPPTGCGFGSWLRVRLDRSDPCRVPTARCRLTPKWALRRDRDRPA